MTNHMLGQDDTLRVLGRFTRCAAKMIYFMSHDDIIDIL